MSLDNKEKTLIATVFSGNCSKKNICPVKDIMANYGDKWSIYTILLLGQHDKMRFSELRTLIKGISQRMLTVTLRSLEENGIVIRHIHHQIPPRVDYQLTALGEGLLKNILPLANWAEENGDEIIRARETYKKVIISSKH